MLNRIPMSRTGWYSRTMERWVDSTCAVCVRHAWLQAGSCRWFFWVVLCSHYLVLLGVKPSFGVIFLKNKYLVIKSVRSPADIGFCAASDCPLGMWFAGWRSSIEYRYESFQKPDRHRLSLASSGFDVSIDPIRNASNRNQHEMMRV